MDPVSPYTDESDVNNMSRGNSPYKPAVNDFEKERQNYFIASPSSESDSLVETDQEVKLTLSLPRITIYYKIRMKYSSTVTASTLYCALFIYKLLF